MEIKEKCDDLQWFDIEKLPENIIDRNKNVIENMKLGIMYDDGDFSHQKNIKNKVAPPFREAEFDVMYGQGISKEGNVFDMAVNLDIVQKSGSWFSYNGERIGQGRENAKRYLVNSKLMDEVEKKVREDFAKAFEQSLGEEVLDEDNEEPEE